MTVWVFADDDEEWPTAVYATLDRAMDAVKELHPPDVKWERSTTGMGIPLLSGGAKRFHYEFYELPVIE